MTLHKIVNGKIIELSKEEEDAVKEEWRINGEKEHAKKQEFEAKKSLREAALQKIYSVANLTEEEIAVMKL